jgi:hypothetical protein
MISATRVEPLASRRVISFQPAVGTPDQALDRSATVQTRAHPGNTRFRMRMDGA